MNNYSRGPQIETNTVVFYLIAINIVFFVVSNFLPGLVPGGPEMLAMYYPSSEYFRPFQIFTHMFMHANFMHILMNMYGVFLFGTILERIWGPRRFLEYYFMTGLGSIALYTAVKAFQIYGLTGSLAPNNLLIQPYGAVWQAINSPVLGASGAVFGILIAFAMLFPNTELYLMFIPVPVKAKWLVGGYVAFELFSGVRNSAGDNVAHFAHLGGALIGFIVVTIWNRNRNTLY